MKCRLRKLTSALLAVIIVFSVLTVAPFMVSAASFVPRTTAPDNNNAYYYNSAYNPFSRGQCTWYVWGRAFEITGIRPKYSTYPCDGKDVFYNCKSAGYSTGSVPKVGAIACWGASNSTWGYGHVAIVEKIIDDTVYVSEYNRVGSLRFSYNAIPNLPNFIGYVYLGNFSNDEYVDLGTEFYAYIINTASWKHLTNDTYNVSVRTLTGEANQVWKFERQSDGSYKIISTQDGLVLDDVNFGIINGNNVAVCESNNTTAQRWYIYGTSGAYYLRAKCGSLVLDVNEGSSVDGTNVQMWNKNDGIAQKFQIWKLNKAASSYVHCAAGTTYTPTLIWWVESSDTLYYDVKIWKDKLWEGEPYKILWDRTDLECQVNLPAGYYEAYVDSRNKFSISMSQNIIKFTVTEGVPLDIGDEFYTELLVTENWINVSNINSNVQLENTTVINNKIWKFKKQNDNSYIIESCADGKVMEVDNSGNKNGDNVKVCELDGSDSQKWYIYGRWSGEYYLKPKCSDKVLNINGGNIVKGENVQIYELNYTPAQKLAIYKVDPSVLNPIEIVKLGDVNCNGEVTIDDVTLIQKYLATMVDFADEQEKVADVDNDGKVSIDDVTLIQKYLAGIISNLG